MLKNYLEALESGDHQAAYDLLSPEWRTELSYDSFQAGYQTTRVTGYSIGEAETVDQRHVKIKARIEVEELKRHAEHLKRENASLRDQLAKKGAQK